GAFVEQSGSEPRQALLPLRISRRSAALEANGDGDQRIAVILDQPGLDAPRAHHPFDPSRFRQRRQQAGDDQGPKNSPEQTSRHGAFSASSSPVAEVLIWKTLRAAAMTSAGVTAAIRSDQAWISS